MLEETRFKQAFPFHLENDLNMICQDLASIQLFKSPEFCKSYNQGFTVVVNDEKLIIPQRQYLDIPPTSFIWTATQQKIIDCYYTRHCDGRIREKFLKKIILHRDEWVIPYIMQLVGEYVIEILQVIYNNLNGLDMAPYREFVCNNQAFYLLTKQRVTSYWDCYYRWLYKRKNDYVGFKILDLIKTN